LGRSVREQGIELDAVIGQDAMVFEGEAKFLGSGEHFIVTRFERATGRLNQITRPYPDDARGDQKHTENEEEGAPHEEVVGEERSQNSHAADTKPRSDFFQSPMSS
jgi:hypothetical protein